ncbi:MAG: EAL domain-containing protein, partial [Pseudomonadota bacterium]
GLTSMTMLGYAPLDVIKLDAVLIARLPEPRALLVLEAAIRLAHDLRLKVVAEGVETVEQFSCLKQIGCDYAQGFGIAPPMPMPELEAFMRSYGKAPIWISQAQRSA